MILDVAILRRTWAGKLVPLCVVLVLGYIDYAALYALGYREIYTHHAHKTAVSLWVLVSLTQALLFLYWGMIYGLGPGKCPQIPPYTLIDYDGSGSSDAPLHFLCDDRGFPCFLLEAQSMIPPRGYWLRHTESMVPRFDHYCLWIGCVIGRGNYIQFLKFMVNFLAFFVIILLYLSIYTRQNHLRGVIDHNFIVLFVLSGFWIIMLLALIGQHVMYITQNRTTIEDLAKTNKTKYDLYQKRKERGKAHGRVPREELGKRYLNIESPRGSRCVVEFDVRERPYDMGWYQNWLNLVFNCNINHGFRHEEFSVFRLVWAVLVLTVPGLDFIYMRQMASSFAKFDTISPTFYQSIMKKIERGQFSDPEYLVKSV